MKRLFPAAISAASFLLGAAQLHAADFVIGLGYTDFGSNEPPNTRVLSLEAHGDSFRNLGQIALSPMLVFTVHDGGDYYAGIGLSGRYDLKNDWFIEGSFAPGIYLPDNDATDLGHHLEFRSVLGVGYQINDDNAVSVAVTHRSNGGIADRNPGVDTVEFRWRKSF